MAAPSSLLTTANIHGEATSGASVNVRERPGFSPRRFGITTARTFASALRRSVRCSHTPFYLSRMDLKRRYKPSKPIQCRVVVGGGPDSAGGKWQRTWLIAT